MNAPFRIASVAASLALSLGAQAPQLVFTDVTTALGIDWVQVENNTMMAAGGAFLDFDGDGRLDVLLAGGAGEPGLYRNTGSGFVAVTPPPFTNPLGIETMCTTVADIDNDGDPDVFFGRFGPNQLFRNDGGGVFTDITTQALAGARFGFTTTAAFGDYDADGNLDLYVGNYIAPGSSPPYHTPTPNVLFRGHGDGTFTDVTEPIVAGAGVALASTWSDFDGDGDVDILLANDFGAFVEPNQLYRNDGPARSGWRFTEASHALGTDLRIYCMGIAVGDCDRDGDFDYYFTNLGRNVLLRNDGARFADITTATGTEVTFDPGTTPPLLATSWGTGFHDFDNDGWLDLYVSNGHIPADPSLANGEHTRNVVFRHDGPAMTFTANGTLDDGIGRGVAFGDFDDDGDVDVLQVNVGGPPVLLRNDTPRQGHWLTAALRGRASNRDAIGARVDADVGAFTAIREVRRNDSFEASSDPRLHFGFGDAAHVRSATVRWPSGIRQRLFDVAIDQRVTVVEPWVTLEDEELRTWTLPFGRLLWFRAELVAHGTDARDVVYGAELRVGDGRHSPFGAPGSTVWRGDLRPAHLAAGHRRPISTVCFVPRGVPLPDPLDLDFVWVARDADGAVDEAQVAVR